MFLSNGLNQFIQLNDIVSVLSHFGLDSTQAATAYILDQDNFQITAELFPIIIRQFQNPAVHIRIIFNFHENTAFDLVSLYSKFILK